MSVIRPMLGVARPSASSAAPDRRQFVQLHVRQHQVLLVGDADLVQRIALGEVGDGVHLLGASSRPESRRSSSARRRRWRSRAPCAAAMLWRDEAGEGRIGRLGAPRTRPTSPAASRTRAGAKAARMRASSVSGRSTRGVGLRPTPPRPGGRTLGAEAGDQDLDARLARCCRAGRGGCRRAGSPPGTTAGRRAGRSSRMRRAEIGRAAEAAADQHLEAQLAVRRRAAGSRPMSCTWIAARSVGAPVTAILNLRGR